MSLLIKTYSFYTSRNQRIAAYGRLKEGKLEITMIICSAKDHFRRKLADTADELLQHAGTVTVRGMTIHPKVVQLEPGDKPKQTFLDYMERDFYRKAYRIITYRRAFLYKRKEGIGASSAIPVGKKWPLVQKLSMR